MYLKERFITASAIFLAVSLIGTTISLSGMIPSMRPMLAKADTGPTCPAGTTFTATPFSRPMVGLCTDGSACQSPSTFQSGDCVSSTPATCTAPATGPDSSGQCTTTSTTPGICTTGTLQGGQCVSSTSTPPTCTPSTITPDSQGQCTTTTSTAPTCPPGTSGGGSGQCVAGPTCPSGMPFGVPLDPTTLLCGFPGGPNDANGQPTCPFGGSWNGSDGLCVVGPPTCPSGTSLVAHDCTSQPTCTSGTLQGGVCVSTSTTPGTCIAPATLQGGQCVSSTSTPPTCTPPTISPDSQGQCTTTTSTDATCLKGTLESVLCVTDTPINCPAGTAPDDSGTCVATPDWTGFHECHLSDGSYIIFPNGQPCPPPGEPAPIQDIINSCIHYLNALTPRAPAGEASQCGGGVRG